MHRVGARLIPLLERVRLAVQRPQRRHRELARALLDARGGRFRETAVVDGLIELRSWVPTHVLGACGDVLAEVSAEEVGLLLEVSLRHEGVLVQPDPIVLVDDDEALAQPLVDRGLRANLLAGRLREVPNARAAPRAAAIEPS